MYYFYWLSNTPLCICTTAFLSIHLLMDMTCTPVFITALFIIARTCKHTLNIWYNNHIPRYSPRVENSCVHKTQHIDVYSTFIHNSPNLEADKISFNRLMEKITATFRQRNIIQPWKTMSYQLMERHYYVLEANLKRQHTVWFQEYDILEKTKLQRR